MSTDEREHPMKPQQEGVYGENHPPEDDRPEPDIREEVAEEGGTAEQLDEARRDQRSETNPSGGMGRIGTPLGTNTQGKYSREEDAPGPS